MDIQGTTQRQKHYKAIRDLTETNKIRDVHRKRNPQCNKHTFRQIKKPEKGETKPRVTTTHIDYCLTNKSMERRITNTDILSAPIHTDHDLVSITFLTDKPRHHTPNHPTNQTHNQYTSSTRKKRGKP